MKCGEMNTYQLAFLLRAAYAHIHNGGSLDHIEAQACAISVYGSDAVAIELVRQGHLKRASWSSEVYITISGLSACLEGIRSTHSLWDPIHDHLADHTEALWTAEAQG